MGHFDISRWVDLVRGLAGKQERAMMEAHLSSGCEKCRRTVDRLREVTALALREGNYDVPRHAVHAARAIFALNQPEKVYFLPRIVGRLVYDSFKEPLPAGLRARHRLTRHALYEAEDYSLDLRLEHEAGAPGVNLVGQIASLRDPDKSFANLPVFLLSGKEIIARAVSNEFGEFQILYQPRRHMRLHVQAGQSTRRGIEVPLSRLPGEGSSRRKKRG